VFSFQTSAPIMVRVIEQPVHRTSIADVIFGAIGLVGILLIVAALCGLVLGAILIGVKRLRARDGLPTQAERDSLRVTPLS